MPSSKVVGFLLVLLIAAEYTGWRVLDQAAVAVLVLLVIALVWSRWSMRGVGFERRLMSDRAMVGEELQETLHVSNRSRFPKLWLEVWDYSTLPGYRANRVMQVWGKSSQAWSVSQHCSARGAFRLGPVTLRTGDPLGFFPRRKTIPLVHDVLIYPATVDVSRFRLPVSVLSGGKSTIGRHPMETSTISGVRDYDPGDSLNRISWNATARSGRLMTKEFDLDPTSDVWIVVDLDRRQHAVEMYGPEDPSYRAPVAPWLISTEEYAVTIAASLAKRCLDEGRVLGMIVSGGRLETIPPDRSERQYVKVLESLALAQADGNMPIAECLVAESRRFKRQSTVIVITASVAEDWVTPLASLRFRGTLASVILLDQSSFGPASSSLMAVSALTAMEIPMVLIKHGEEIGTALASGQPDPTSRRDHYVHG